MDTAPLRLLPGVLGSTSVQNPKMLVSTALPEGVKVASQSVSKAGHWSLQLEERIFPLGEPVVRMGRGLSNDVILDDRRVSRRHAQLRWRGGTYHLSDMGSSGGTTLDGRSVRQGQEVPLAAGDTISLAGVVLTVRLESSRPALDVLPTSSASPP